MITTVCLNPSFDKTATLSELKPGELNRLEQVRVDLGGKGLNVATVLSRLGVQTRCVGCLGSENASLFLRMVGREKLTFEYLMVSGEVRTNLKLCEKNTKAITEINEPGPSVSEEELQSFLTLLEEKAQDSSYVVFSGRLPQNCGEDTYQRCIHSLPGKKCVLDAAGESLLRGIKEKPYLIKPNLPEIEGIVSRELKTLSAALLLIEYGAQNVIVSMGKMGAVLVTPQRTLFSPALPVTASSTVGAGDAMLGGVLMGLDRGVSLEDAFRFGVAAGAASVMTDGTQLLSREDFENLVPRVTVQEV